jgi:hypothetical protein
LGLDSQIFLIFDFEFLRRRQKMKLKVTLLSILFLLLSNALCYAWNYPRDGRFKRIDSQNDPWFYVDEEHWDIKAPDKWQHFTGCYVSQKLLSKHMNKYLSGLLILSLGLYKEYEDAYREGWSPRDLAVDALGILTAMYDRPSAKVLCTYDQEKVMLNLVFPLK